MRYVMSLDKRRNSMTKKRKTVKMLLGGLLTLAMVFGMMPGVTSPANAAAPVGVAHLTSVPTVATIGNIGYSSLEEAASAAAAQSGATIELQQNVTITNSITLNNGITLNGNNHSVTRANNKVFIVANSSLVTIAGIKITNSGRALEVPSGSTVILKDSEITGCSYGLKAAIQLNGTALLDNTLISNNQSTDSNAGGVIEMGFPSSKLYGINSRITNNIAASHTGGINNYYGSVYLMKCRITDNHSTGGNYAEELGGGVRTGDNFYAANCVITANKSGPSSGQTLDIGGTPVLKHCVYGSVISDQSAYECTVSTNKNAEIPSNQTEFSYTISNGTLSVVMKYDSSGTLVDLSSPLDTPVISALPTAVSGGNPNYTGSAISLVNNGTVTGGGFVYSLGTNATTAPASDSFSASIPTGTQAGTYYVWYKVLGDSGYESTSPACLTVTITEASSGSGGSSSGVGSVTETVKPVVSKDPSVGKTEVGSAE